MNSTAMRLRGGDVIELEIDGDIVSALVLLANNENVIFDLVRRQHAVRGTRKKTSPTCGSSTACAA